MQISKFKETIRDLLKINTPLIWVTTQEEEFAEEAIIKTAAANNFTTYYYCGSDTGSFRIDPLTMKPTNTAATRSLDDEFNASGGEFVYPDSFPSVSVMLTTIKEFTDNTMIILRDPSDIAKSTVCQRAIKDVVERKMHKDKVFSPIIMISTQRSVPLMLKNLAVSVDLPLMDAKECAHIIAAFAKHAHLENLDFINLGKHASGLTYFQIKQALKESYNKTHTISADFLNETRISVIKQSSILTYIEPKKTLDSIGGHKKLKKWIKEVSSCNTEEALSYGIKPCKGMVALGIAGTGKTAIAEAIANYFKVPFIIFDLSKIMGGIVGQSEQTARYAFDLINAIGSCVVLIDECDKQFAGTSSSSTQDGGTIARVFDVVLQNLQNNNNQFYILTANDISKLPSPLMRAGRIDSKWFFGFPKAEDRKQIFNIYFNNAGKSVPDDFLDYAANVSDHFTGAEIETAVNNILRISFLGDKNITKSNIYSGINKVATVYKTNRGEIDELLEYAEQNNIPYTDSEDNIKKEIDEDKLSNMEDFISKSVEKVS